VVAPGFVCREGILRQRETVRSTLPWQHRGGGWDVTKAVHRVVQRWEECGG